MDKYFKNYNSHNNELCVHRVVSLSLFICLTLTVIINTLVSLSVFVFHYFCMSFLNDLLSELFQS